MNSGFVGYPIAKVELGFGQIAGWAPSEVGGDFHAVSLSSHLGEKAGNMTNLIFDPAGECFYRTIKWVNRNNYLSGTGIEIAPESPLYRDSDASLEMRRRSFTPIAHYGQLPFNESDFSQQYDRFMKPNPSSYYPTNYNGPKWSHTPISTTSAAGDNSITNIQWLTQTEGTSGIGWALRQEAPNFRNQAFWIDIRGTKPLPPFTDPESGNYKTPLDPYPGSYFSIVIGGSMYAELDAMGKVTSVSRGNMDSKNSYTIVFPIDNYPFIIDNNRWFKRLKKREGNLSALTLEDMVKIIGGSTLSTASFETWLISADKLQGNGFQISVMMIKNRIFIRSSISSEAWIFPDAFVQFRPGEDEPEEENEDTAKPGAQEPVYADRLVADQSASSGVSGFSIEPIPIEVRGRGFICNLNINPMEFDQGPAFLDLPEMTYGKDQKIDYFYEVKANSRHGNMDKFALPSSEAGQVYNYGVDYEPYWRCTQMGLPPDCIDVAPSPGFPRSALGHFGKTGAAQVRGSSEMAALSMVTQYRVTFKPCKSVDHERGFESASSAAYRTPIFFRVKFKGNTSFSRKPNWIDITPHVMAINHSVKQTSGWTYLEKSFQITCLIPKTSDRAPYPIRNRTSVGGISWNRLTTNPCLIRVWMGTRGSGVPSYMDTLVSNPNDVYFTGISLGGVKSETAERDTLTLQCRDFTYVLEQVKLFGNVVFDGMSLPYAIGHCLERAGFQTFGNNDSTAGVDFVITQRAIDDLVYNKTLPDSGRFSAPLLRLQKGTRLLEAVKQFTQRFNYVFGTDNRGRFMLDVPPAGGPTGSTLASVEARFSDTNDLPHHPRLTFYSKPQDASGKYHNVLLGEKTLRSDIGNRATSVHVEAVSKYTGAREIVSDGSIRSIIDPMSEDFMGFMQPHFTPKSALGGRAEAKRLVGMMKKIGSKPTRICTIQIYGRKDIQPLEIMKVDKNNFRILEVSGTMSLEGAPSWKMQVTGECRGAYNADVDTSSPPTSTGVDNDFEV